MKGSLLFLSIIAIFFTACNHDFLEIEKKEQFKYSALHTAVRLGNFENVKELINDKDLNVQDPYGDTPLMDALRNNSTKIATFLICNKADINIKDKHNYTALDIAVRNDNTKLVKLLNSKDINLLCDNSFLKKELANINKQSSVFNNENLSFTFFKQNNLDEEFKAKLKLFIPELFKVLKSKENSIKKILINIHTQSFAKDQTTQIGMFMANTKRSKKTARLILKYIKSLQKSSLVNKLEAKGLSSKELILNNGVEDSLNSNRIEFKIILK